MSFIQPGDRIRMVTFAVTTSDGGVRNVQLRYPWSGPAPEHVCNPTECAWCESEVHRIATRRLQSNARITSIQAVRDRQTVNRGPRPDAETVVAAQPAVSVA